MVQDQPLLDYIVGPYGPGPLIIWKNILSQICSRIIFEMYTAPGACSKYASGAVCFQIMLVLDLDHKSRPKSHKSVTKGDFTIKTQNLEGKSVSITENRSRNEIKCAIDNHNYNHYYMCKRNFRFKLKLSGY